MNNNFSKPSVIESPTATTLIAPSLLFTDGFRSTGKGAFGSKLDPTDTSKGTRSAPTTGNNANVRTTDHIFSGYR
jgi:hypothetical protein